METTALHGGMQACKGRQDRARQGKASQVALSIANPCLVFCEFEGKKALSKGLCLFMIWCVSTFRLSRERHAGVGCPHGDTRRYGTPAIEFHRGIEHNVFELYSAIDCGFCDRVFPSDAKTLSKGRRDQPDDRADSRSGEKF